MKLNETFAAFDLCFASNVTPALVGTSGVGKTSIGKLYGKARNFDKIIILRPSLVADVGDLVGLPDFEVIAHDKSGKEIKRTTFQSPDWLPLEHEKALIIVDEINRTQKEIIMAMFDLIEAEHPKIGKFELPKGSRVLATLNPPTDNYNVLDLKDSAFISRLCFLKVMPDLQVFVDWGKETGEVTDHTLEFFQKNDKFFGLGENFDIGDGFGINIKDNNRSKKKVSDLEKNSKLLNTPETVLFECIQGVGGKEFAVAYTNFLKEYHTIITVRDIMDIPEKLNKFDFGAMSNVSKVLEDLKAIVQKENLTPTQVSNLTGFLVKVPLDTLKGFVYFLAEVDGNDDSPESVNMDKFCEDLAGDSNPRQKEMVARLKEIAHTEEKANESV